MDPEDVAQGRREDCTYIALAVWAKVQPSTRELCARRYLMGSVYNCNEMASYSKEYLASTLTTSRMGFQPRGSYHPDVRADSAMT